MYSVHGYIIYLAADLLEAARGLEIYVQNGFSAYSWNWLEFIILIYSKEPFETFMCRLFMSKAQ